MSKSVAIFADAKIRASFVHPLFAALDFEKMKTEEGSSSTKRLLVSNTIYLLFALVCWLGLDYLYVVKGGNDNSLVQTVSNIYKLVPIGFFLCTWWSLKESSILSKIGTGIVAVVVFSSVGYLLLITVGIPFHFYVGGKL